MQIDVYKRQEISLVTTGEAKYYNRLYKFFQYTDIQCTADTVSYTHLNKSRRYCWAYL